MTHVAAEDQTFRRKSLPPTPALRP